MSDDHRRAAWIIHFTLREHGHDDALRDRADETERLLNSIEAATAVDAERVSQAQIQTRTEQLFTAWRGDLFGPVDKARQAIKKIMTTPLVLTAKSETYELRVRRRWDSRFLA